MNSNKVTTLLIAIMLLTIPLYATTMFQLSLQDLSTGAEKVVQAKVTAIVTQWNKDQTVIYTYIRMNIMDDFIGDDEDNEIIIKQLGGKIGEITLFVEGASTYNVGDENVLFLFTDPLNLSAFQTVGMCQGKYVIYTDADGIRRVRQDDAAGVELLKKRDAHVVETGDSYTLEEFKAQVLLYRSESGK